MLNAEQRTARCIHKLEPSFLSRLALAMPQADATDPSFRGLGTPDL
jgi:hypothetical protein